MAYIHTYAELTTNDIKPSNTTLGDIRAWTWICFFIFYSPPPFCARCNKNDDVSTIYIRDRIDSRLILTFTVQSLGQSVQSKLRTYQIVIGWQRRVTCNSSNQVVLHLFLSQLRDVLYNSRDQNWIDYAISQSITITYANSGKHNHLCSPQKNLI